MHRNPLRHRPQRIRRHLRCGQSHRILRVKHAVPVQRVTARSARIISRSNQTLSQLSRRLLRIFLLQQRRHACHQRGRRRRTRPQHVPVTGRRRNHVGARGNHSNRNTLSRRALRNLLIPIHTANRQHTRNSRRSAHLSQTATAITRSSDNQHALLFRVGKSVVPALRPARLIRTNRHVDNLCTMVNRVAHSSRNLLVDTLAAGRTHIQRNRQNLRLRSHTNHAGRLTRLTRNGGIPLSIMTVAGNQRGNLRTVHRLSAQTLPAILAAHARNIGTA